MSGNKIFIDTNIIVYLLNGDDTLATFLQGQTVYVSFITQLELLGYQGLTKDEEEKIENFLESCVIIDINPSIKKEVIKLRKTHKIKLPDAIIMGSSSYMDLPILTSDDGFNKVEKLEVIYYDFGGSNQIV